MRKIPKKLTKKQKLVDKIFKPNDVGKSEWISREVLDNTELNWGNNGMMRHRIAFGDCRFIWEKLPSKGAIEKLRTVGFNPDKLAGLSRPIHPDIDKHHKQMGCVVCGSNSSLVTDHKNDLYNDTRVLDIKEQTIDDFQCLCTHCNLQKREISKKTKAQRKRIGATSIPSLAIFKIDFISGDDNFNEDDINAMKGTYWYDPVAFMKYIKNNVCS